MSFPNLLGRRKKSKSRTAHGNRRLRLGFEGLELRAMLSAVPVSDAPSGGPVSDVTEENTFLASTNEFENGASDSDPRLDPDERPIMSYILASTDDFDSDEKASDSDPRLDPDERPIMSYILASTDDFDSDEKASSSEPELEPDERPIIEDILGSTEDFQASADGVWRMLGIDNDSSSRRSAASQPTTYIAADFPWVEQDAPAPADPVLTPDELPIVMDVLGSTKDFQL